MADLLSFSVTRDQSFFTFQQGTTTEIPTQLDKVYSRRYLNYNKNDFGIWSQSQKESTRLSVMRNCSLDTWIHMVICRAELFWPAAQIHFIACLSLIRLCRLTDYKAKGVIEIIHADLLCSTGWRPLLNKSPLQEQKSFQSGIHSCCKNPGDEL